MTLITCDRVSVPSRFECLLACNHSEPLVFTATVDLTDAIMQEHLICGSANYANIPVPGF